MITVDIKPCAVRDFPSPVFSNARILAAILHIHRAYVHMADNVPMNSHVLADHKSAKHWQVIFSRTKINKMLTQSFTSRGWKFYQSYGPTQVCFRNVTSPRIQVELILSVFSFPPEVGWKSLQEKLNQHLPQRLIRGFCLISNRLRFKYGAYGK